MYLKTLTLRGFKSFASATSMRFEPGITCVVGPNGSGKSNVVDAFSWVMGEQGVKPLRGGKMEDVVFAGTAGRPALGRAEVTLTIDNSDGALPIDYAEVTISRLLFRSGQSEYAINGDHCRLLDVQELLSDSGLGREMHVIVGQGQLDEVLNAGPEARRALIEEAAGVLKHRRRKEKAQRKLEAMQANLTRLVDLTGELGRRLKPLGRQAEIARRAAVIQADLRDARLRLLADDYVTLAAELDLRDADEAAAVARRTELEQLLAAAQATETELDLAEQEHAPRLAAAQQTWFDLSGLAERLRGCRSVAAERHRLLSAPPEPQRPGRDPDELDREAAALREQEAALGGQLSAARGQLAAAVSGRTEAEAALSALDRQLAQDARAAVHQGRAAGPAARPGRGRPGHRGGGQGRRGPAGRGAGPGPDPGRARPAPVRAGTGPGLRPRAGPVRAGRRARAGHRGAGRGQRPGRRAAQGRAPGQRRPCGAARPGRDADRGGQARRGRVRPAAVRREPVQRGGRGVRRAAHRRGRRAARRSPPRSAPRPARSRCPGSTPPRRSWPG